jgi:acyl-CoA thioester hydrolase
MEATLGAGLFPVVMESTQRYMRELKMFDEVRIESEFSGSSGLITYKHNIINERTGLISCKVTGKIAFVNKERIICDVPDEVLEYLER